MAPLCNAFNFLSITLTWEFFVQHPSFKRVKDVMIIYNTDIYTTLTTNILLPPTLLPPPLLPYVLLDLNDDIKSIIAKHLTNDTRANSK
jgi:hypothetical protein